MLAIIDYYLNTLLTVSGSRAVARLSAGEGQRGAIKNIFEKFF
jgi:hypothetical protein